MTRHNSYGKSSKAAKRSVLQRFERIEVLKKLGRFPAGSKATGLPKTPIQPQ